MAKSFKAPVFMHKTWVSILGFDQTNIILNLRIYFEQLSSVTSKTLLSSEQLMRHVSLKVSFVDLTPCIDY